MDTPDFKEHFSSLLTESEEHLAVANAQLAELEATYDAN